MSLRGICQKRGLSGFIKRIPIGIFYCLTVKEKDCQLDWMLCDEEGGGGKTTNFILSKWYFMPQKSINCVL